jgi:hypothetical protein
MRIHLLQMHVMKVIHDVLADIRRDKCDVVAACRECLCKCLVENIMARAGVELNGTVISGVPSRINVPSSTLPGNAAQHQNIGGLIRFNHGTRRDEKDQWENLHRSTCDTRCVWHRTERAGARDRK